MWDSGWVCVCYSVRRDLAGYGVIGGSWQDRACLAVQVQGVCHLCRSAPGASLQALA